MAELVTDFDRIWTRYPKRVGKGAARKVWAKLQPDTALVQQMLDALIWQRTQPGWLKDGGSSSRTWQLG